MAEQLISIQLNKSQLVEIARHLAPTGRLYSTRTSRRTVNEIFDKLTLAAKKFK